MSWDKESLKEAARQLKKSRKEELVYENKSQITCFKNNYPVKKLMNNFLLLERFFTISNLDFKNNEYKKIGIDISLPIPFCIKYAKIDGFVSKNYAGGGDLWLQIVDQSLPDHCLCNRQYHYMEEPIKLDDKIFPLDNWNCCSFTKSPDILISINEKIEKNIKIELLIQDTSEIKINKNNNLVSIICSNQTKLGDLAEYIGNNDIISMKATLLSNKNCFVDIPQKTEFVFGSQLFSNSYLNKVVNINKKLSVVGKMTNPTTDIEYNLTMQLILEI